MLLINNLSIINKINWLKVNKRHQLKNFINKVIYKSNQI
jgi:hypothetical protein